MGAPDLSSYVTVADRLAGALAKYPELRVVESPPEVVTIGNAVFLSVEMTVYRDADDPIPCVARAWEPFPGRTPYTRDSEQMNASTSALGRCLGLMGFGIAKSISSADEVAVARSRTSEPRPKSTTATGKSAPESGDTLSAGLLRLIAAKAERYGVPVPELINRKQADEWLDRHAGFDTKGDPK